VKFFWKKNIYCAN